MGKGFINKDKWVTCPFCGGIGCRECNFEGMIFDVKL